MQGPQNVRVALERLIESSVVPIAKRYDYGAQSLQPSTTWKPTVLVIGNYSSGKSSLINELVGAPIQRTGQAPTDDCFTILTAPNETPAGAKPSELLAETPGSSIVNDPSMPFSSFKDFGSRFVSHFVMKTVNCPALANLAVIDSPGMLDSVTELDRGYDYQQVVGRFAELADLVVLIFDPHRAGTIKETYVAIRSTLPEATGEDRVAFVLNRIDECKDFTDLARCYGVLCWNLSQMTGRKDIPRIFLTYSKQLAMPGHSFVELSGERDELLAKIEQAPRHQIGRLLGAADHHLHRLKTIAQVLGRAAWKRTTSIVQYWLIAIAVSLGGALLVDALVAALLSEARSGFLGRMLTGNLTRLSVLLPVVLFAGALTAAWFFFIRLWLPAFDRSSIDNADSLADGATRYEQDLWQSVRPKVVELMANPKNLRPFASHAANAARVDRILKTEVKQLYDAHLTGNGR